MAAVKTVPNSSVNRETRKQFENLKPISSLKETKPQTFLAAPGSRWLLPACHTDTGADSGKVLARTISFLQQKNIDFILISASADIQELREKLPGAGLALPWAVAPCPCPMAGTEPPTAARVPRLEPATAWGWDQHRGLLPKLSARAVTAPQAPQRRAIAGKALEQDATEKLEGVPCRGEKSSGFLEHGTLE